MSKRQRAEQERQRAEQAETLLVQQRQRVETEHEQLILKLRARGINPEEFFESINSSNP